MIIPTSRLSDVVCWTRMQSEAGQPIESIIARKELERKAGDGVFFWGVGNAPSRFTRKFVTQGEDIDVVFSLMKTKPKKRDVHPSGVLVWNTYIDSNGIELLLPPHVLVTSRMEAGAGIKDTHYSLICVSNSELQLDEQGPTFDPSVYRNVGEAGGAVSHSQVTALVKRTRTESLETNYRINLRAKLTSSYWVRLAKPCLFDESARWIFAEVAHHANDIDNYEWLKMISQLRNLEPSILEEQCLLF